MDTENTTSGNRARCEFHFTSPQYTERAMADVWERQDICCFLVERCSIKPAYVLSRITLNICQHPWAQYRLNYLHPITKLFTILRRGIPLFLKHITKQYNPSMHNFNVTTVECSYIIRLLQSYYHQAAYQKKNNFYTSGIQPDEVTSE